MKQKFILTKTVVALAFLTLGGWTLAAKSNAGAVETLSNGQNGTAAPRDLYVKNCARCHGADGKSDTNLGKSLDADDLTGKGVQNMSEAKITRVISGGADNMPAFGKKLSATEITSIARYVKTLK